MKTLILSTAMIMGLGAAAPAMAQGVYIGGPGARDRGGDCRMVEKRVERGNRTVITKERRCDGDRRVYRNDDRRDRYVDRRDNRPGIYIGPR